MATRHFIQLVNEQLPKSAITLERPGDNDRADECAKYIEPEDSRAGSEADQSTPNAAANNSRT